MTWVLFVLFGAVINGIVNYGYKTYATKVGIFLLMSGVMIVGALGTLIYALIVNPGGFASLFVGWTPVVVLAMGSGMAAVWIIIITAFAKGPLSLIDPLWACIYALGSVAIGMIAAHENPGWMSLAGIGLYLLGAVLMAQDGKKPKPVSE